ncbi:hypothetical protein D9757_004982 [Collybiopsis confluens]|uniref:Fungal-type protein kinase domain-containing protein n=1 Tax=Collybiopsis confluens TaxID=2823264 RepID=A0A8H5HTE2_9AGAR|nr:hypothetical protein D9757_004982 [Collybiopsis confluens]
MINVCIFDLDLDMDIHPVSAPPAPTTPHRPPISDPIKIIPQTQNAVSRTKADGSDVLKTQTVDLRTVSQVIFDQNLKETDLAQLDEEIEAKLEAYLEPARTGLASDDLARVFNSAGSLCIELLHTNVPQNSHGFSSTKKHKSSGGLPAPGFQGTSTALVTPKVSGSPSNPEDKASAFNQRTRESVIPGGLSHLADGKTLVHTLDLVWHLRSLSHENLGLIPNMEPSSSQHFKSRSERECGNLAAVVDSRLVRISLFSNHESYHPSLTLAGSTYTLVVEGVNRVLRVTQVIFRSDGLIGRGTNVLGVDCIEEEVMETAHCTTVTPEQLWKGEPLILKLSFPPSEQTKESELIDAARAHATAHAGWALQHLSLIIASADSLDWEDAYEMRSLRATILEKLEPLSTLRVCPVHRWLYKHPEILHRDLSMGNMYRLEGDNAYGVLNDFEKVNTSPSLLTCVDKGPTSKHQTGTKPFMLDTKWAKGHLYRHDLELLLHIILVVSCHCSGPTTRTSSLPFEDWFKGVDEVIFALETFTIVISRASSK